MIYIKRLIMCALLSVQVVHATVLEELISLAATQITTPGEQEQTVIIKTKKQADPISKLARQFMKGAGITATLSFIGLNVAYRGQLKNANKEFWVSAWVSIGIPSFCYYFLQAADVTASRLKAKKCKTCLRPASRQDVLNHWAQVAGSGCAMASIFVLVKLLTADDDE